MCMCVYVRVRVRVRVCMYVCVLESKRVGSRDTHIILLMRSMIGSIFVIDVALLGGRRRGEKGRRQH